MKTTLKVVGRQGLVDEAGYAHAITFGSEDNTTVLMLRLPGAAEAYVYGATVELTIGDVVAPAPAPVDPVTEPLSIHGDEDDDLDGGPAPAAPPAAPAQPPPPRASAHGRRRR